MLRKLLIKDADPMLEWMNDADISKNFRFTKMFIREDAVRFILESSVEPDDGQSIHYAIVDENDEYLGTISLKNISLKNKNGEYAISLRKSAQGKGVAFKATLNLLSIAFNSIMLERVYLNVLADNRKAISLYERAGFRFEGEFKNHLLINNELKSLKWFAILKNEFWAKYEGIIQ